jgi:hypothetical protein
MYYTDARYFELFKMPCFDMESLSCGSHNPTGDFVVGLPITLHGQLSDSISKQGILKSLKCISVVFDIL